MTKTKLERSQIVAIQDLTYAMQTAIDHICNDRRAASPYERFVKGAVCNQAANAISNIHKAFDIECL